MRKLFLSVFIVVLAAATHSYGQKFIPKGTVIGGGAFTVDIGTSKSEFSGFTNEDSHTRIGFTPSASFFVIDDLAVGVGLGLETEKEKDKGSSGGENSFTQITFGPMVRYYFADGPFAEGSFGIGSRKSSFNSGGSTIESNFGLTTWQVGVGYSVRVSDTILLDPMIGYGSDKLDNKDSDQLDSYAGLFVQVGFTLILKTP